MESERKITISRGFAYVTKVRGVKCARVTTELSHSIWSSFLSNFSVNICVAEELEWTLGQLVVSRALILEYFMPGTMIYCFIHVQSRDWNRHWLFFLWILMLLLGLYNALNFFRMDFVRSFGNAYTAFSNLQPYFFHYYLLE